MRQGDRRNVEPPPAGGPARTGYAIRGRTRGRIRTRIDERTCPAVRGEQGVGPPGAREGSGPLPRGRRERQNVPPRQAALSHGAPVHRGRGPVRPQRGSAQRHDLLQPGERAKPHPRRSPLPPRGVPATLAVVRRGGPPTHARSEGPCEEPPHCRRHGPRGAQLRFMRPSGRERDRRVFPRAAEGFRGPDVRLQGHLERVSGGPGVHARPFRPSRDSGNVTFLRIPKFGSPDPDARLRTETGCREGPRRRWLAPNRRGDVWGRRSRWLEGHRVVWGPRENGRLDRRQETLPRYNDEERRLGQRGDGHNQGVQRIPREGDRLHSKGAEQARPRSREKEPRLTARRARPREKKTKVDGTRHPVLVEIGSDLARVLHPKVRVFPARSVRAIVAPGPKPLSLTFGREGKTGEGGPSDYPKSAPNPAAASSSETFSSSFFSSFFFSSFFSAGGAAAGAAAGIATAALRASSMFRPSSAAVSAFTRVSSTFTPAAVRTFFRFSSFTGLPAACRTSAPYTYSIRVTSCSVDLPRRPHRVCGPRGRASVLGLSPGET